MFPIRDSVPSRMMPAVTYALILINAVVFFFQLTLAEPELERLFYVFGMVPARLTNPDWAAEVGFPSGGYLSLLTHQFLHGGWLHIISNMWALWIFGDNVEDRMGSLRFAVFYLSCGILAALTHMLTSVDSTIPSVGASGSIAGVLGAYLLLFPASRVVVLLPILFLPFFFEVPAVVYLGVWFFTQLFSGTLALASPDDVGGIAFWAHIGGFVAGMLLCGLFVRRWRPPPRFEPDNDGVEWAWQPRQGLKQTG